MKVQSKFPPLKQPTASNLFELIGFLAGVGGAIFVFYEYGPAVTSWWILFLLLVFAAFTKKRFWRVILFIVAVFAFSPALLDRLVFSLQLSTVKSYEVDTSPIDLTDKTVLFLGSSCERLCQYIFLNGNAHQVVFSHGQFTDYEFHEKPLELDKKKFFSYPEDVYKYPIKSQPVEEKVQSIDLIVLEKMHYPDYRRMLEKEVGTYAGFFGNLFVWPEYTIFAHKGLESFQPNMEHVLYNRIHFNRYTALLPWFPLAKSYKHSHDYLPKDRTLFMDALTVLCGQKNRPNHNRCIQGPTISSQQAAK